MLFPLSLDLASRAVLVVGGGRVAARKVDSLVAAGAAVTVVAPVVCAELATRAGRDAIVVEQRPYRAGEAADYWFVVAATGDPAVNRAVLADGEAARVFVNAADDKNNCSAYLSAVAWDGPVSVAVSTAGASPALASWLRDRLAAAMPAGLGAAAATLAVERAAVQASGRSTETCDWRARIEALLGCDAEGAA